jgi:hypothetical protein
MRFARMDKRASDGRIEIRASKQRHDEINCAVTTLMSMMPSPTVSLESRILHHWNRMIPQIVRWNLDRQTTSVPGRRIVASIGRREGHRLQ